MNCEKPDDSHTTDSAPLRQFSTGATRDTAEGKLDYVRALSPIVLERYVQYLAKHREQPDGSLRDFDNWKKGLPIDESLSSLGRHLIDVWKMLQGFKAFDNHGECNIDDTLCAIIFNASTMLHERLIKQQKADVCIPRQYCPECEEKIAKAKIWEVVPLCDKCNQTTTSVGKGVDRDKPVPGGY